MTRVTAILLSAGWAAAMLQADTGRGAELYRKGDYAQAIEQLREAVTANGEDARAHRLLGLAIVESNGNLDEAARHIGRAGELDPDQNKLAMARLHVARKEYPAAEEILKDAEGEDADYVRGICDLQQQRFRPAAEALERYSGKNPDHAYAHYYAGLAYNGLRRQDRMLTHFEMFLRMKPDAPEARKVRAVLKTGR